MLQEFGRNNTTVDVSGNRWLAEYDDNGNLQNQLFQFVERDSHPELVWLDQSLHEFTFNADGTVASIERSSYQSTGFQKQERDDHFYNEGGDLIAVQTSYWQTNEANWIPFALREMTYNTNGDQTTLSSWRVQPSTQADTFFVKEAFEYHVSGGINHYLLESRYGKQTEFEKQNEQRRIFDFDGKIIRENTTNYWGSTSSDRFGRAEFDNIYSYDEKGNRITQRSTYTSYDKFSIVFLDEFETSFSYDCDNLLTSTTRNHLQRINVLLEIPPELTDASRTSYFYTGGASCDQPEKTQGLFVFPNPVAGDLYMTGDIFSQPARISVFDALGRLVYEEDSNITRTHIISTEGLRTGHYWIRIVQGDRVEHGKIKVFN